MYPLILNALPVCALSRCKTCRTGTQKGTFRSVKGALLRVIRKCAGCSDGMSAQTNCTLSDAGCVLMTDMPDASLGISVARNKPCPAPRGLRTPSFRNVVGGEPGYSSCSSLSLAASFSTITVERTMRPWRSMRYMAGIHLMLYRRDTAVSFHFFSSLTCSHGIP